MATLRLTEKGYRVAVSEAGRRFADDEFAKTPATVGPDQQFLDVGFPR